MAPPDRRAGTTSTLVGVLLIGIFGGRIVSSLLVEAIGWRWVIVLFAAMVLAILPFLRRALDAELSIDGAPTGYGRLLLSTIGLLRRGPELVQAAFVQFFVFAIFNATWTVMVLYLTRAPFDWSILAAGLFGVVGLIAGIVTPLTGRFVDRIGSLPVSGIFIALLLVSTFAMIVDSANLVLFAITMFLATWANQSIMSANQMRVLAANPGRSAQANTLFMFFVFLGGSVGAFLGPIAYAAGGMPRVALLGTLFVVIAAIGWILTGLWARRSRRANAGQALQEPTRA
jgi:predicted MFS family arabinose efflux permease